MPEAPAEECSVCVAVKIRPLVQSEIDKGSLSDLRVTPGCPQVACRDHSFTYDHVYGDPPAERSGSLFEHCVSPLVEGLFRGYNATVFAYGQTGSGKTYTMGSEYRPGGHTDGVIPDVIASIFARVAAVRSTMDVVVRVSFIEIHNEKIRDLLLPAGGPLQRPIVIRESRGKGGGVFVEGAVEREVHNADETAGALEMGSLCRSTASTNMNTKSSRSHAIFTLTVEQRRIDQATATPSALSAGAGEDEDEEAGGTGGIGGGEDDDDGGDDFLVAKMHLVDLAGSERAKRTLAQGMRMKEGIKINESLLVLAKVINAIVEKRFVPYRESKLTRLLQDSLGGNSRTVMIACVSPADINYEETVNTLRYAQRVRFIKTKPVVNCDPLAAQVVDLRAKLAASRAEVTALKLLLSQAGRSPEDVSAAVLVASGTAGRQDSGTVDSTAATSALVKQMEAMRLEMEALELQNSRHHIEMRNVRAELDEATRRWQVSQAQLVALRSACTRGAQELSQDDRTSLLVKAQEGGEMETVRGYLARITELEREVKSLRAFQRLASTMPQRPRHALRAGASPAQATTAEPTDAAAPLTSGAAAEDGASPHPSPSAMSDSYSPGVADRSSRRSRAAGAMEDDGGGTLEEEDEEEEEYDEAGLDVGDLDEQQWSLAEAARALEDQDRMKADMAALQSQLESKERYLQEVVSKSGQVPALRQHYDRMLADLQAERDTLQRERQALMAKLSDLASRTEEERRRLEQQYRERLKAADERLTVLKSCERNYVEAQKLKQRTDRMCEQLNFEIVKIKQQKVAMQRQLEASLKQSALAKAQTARELLHLRREVRIKDATIQNQAALQEKNKAVLQRKIADANAARKKVKELEAAQQRAAATSSGGCGDAAQQQRASNGGTGGTGGTSGGAGGTDSQPSATAPLLRSDKARRQWIEKELDICTMSFEYRRILDGELAQRAEATQQLKTVEKKLMMVSLLTPASPLTAQDGLVAATPVSRAAGHTYKLEPQEQLLARRSALEQELSERNSAIIELQQTIERAKADEEARGGGAADTRRWTGVRSVAEARELLKTLFKTAAYHKSLADDSQVDITQLQEKLDVLRVQLDGARKEAERLRYRAAHHQAAAATAAASPFVESVALRAAGNDTEREVNQLVQELQVYHASSGTPAGSAAASLPAFNHASDAATDPSGDAGGKALRFEGGGGGASPATPLLADGLVRSLGSPGGHAQPFGSVVKRVERYSLSEDDDVVVVDDDDDEDDDDEDGGGDEDEVSGSSSDEGDEDWDLSKATPAPRSRHGRRGSGTSRHPTSAPHSSANGESVPTAVPTAGLSDSRRGSGGSSTSATAHAHQPRNSSERTINGGGGASGKLVSEEREAEVLAIINATRAAQCLPGVQPLRRGRLTKKIIEELLKGKMVGGKAWKAGSKTRDQMLRDLCEYYGLNVPPSDQKYNGAGAANAAAHHPQRSFPTDGPAGGTSVTATALDVSPPQPAGGTSPSGGGGTGPSPGSASPAGSRQQPTTSGGGGAVPSSPNSHSSPRHGSTRVWRTPGPSLFRSSMPSNFFTTTNALRSPAQSPGGGGSGYHHNNNPRDYRTGGGTSAVQEGGGTARRSSSGADSALRASGGGAMTRDARAHSNPTVSPGPSSHQQYNGGTRHDSIPIPEATASPVGSPRHHGAGSSGMVAAVASRYEAVIASRRALAESSTPLGSLGGRGSGGTTPRHGVSHFAVGQFGGGSSMTPPMSGGSMLSDASLSDVGGLLGPGPQRDKVATPMSMYWKEKTLAAKLRTLQMQDLSNDQEAGGAHLARSNPLRMSQPCLSAKDNDALVLSKANAMRESMRPGKTIWK